MTKIVVASGRGVAERWRRQYQQPAGWVTRTAGGSPEDTYNALCALGPLPDPDAAAKLIGNQSWTHPTCSSCSRSVLVAAEFGDSETTKLCADCLREGDAMLRGYEAALRDRQP